ncbi:MAG: hydroxymethylbilane synthase [Bacteroidota bacterium]
MEVRIGTRNSQLALWQTHQVKGLLEAQGIKTTIEEIQSEGDRNQTDALYAMGSVGVFTRALDEALLSDKIDIAVHSAKDIPSSIPEELEIVAFLKRENPREVLLGASKEVQLENFSRPWSIGTSSVRRKAQLAFFAPHIQVKDIRGNLNTRLKKLQNGEYDGILLAYAGVKRMGWEHLITQKLNVQSFVPAVGQGAVAVVAKRSYDSFDKVRSLLNHKPTDWAIRAERSFLRTMQGGCHTPIFGLATLVQDHLSLTGGIASLDGKRMVKKTMEGSATQGAELGKQLAREVLEEIQINPLEIHEY